MSKLEGQRKHRGQPAPFRAADPSCQSSRTHAKILATAFWTLRGVVNAASDEGAVEIAVEEFHDDLLPDTRNVDSAPLLTVVHSTKYTSSTQISVLRGGPAFGAMFLWACQLMP